MKCNISKYFQWTAHDTPSVWGSAPSLMVGCWCRQVSAGGHHEAWLWEVQHDEAGPCPVLPGQVWSTRQCSCPGMTSRKLIKQTDIMVIARDIKIIWKPYIVANLKQKKSWISCYLYIKMIRLSSFYVLNVFQKVKRFLSYRAHSSQNDVKLPISG